MHPQDIPLKVLNWFAFKLLVEGHTYSKCLTLIRYPVYPFKLFRRYAARVVESASAIAPSRLSSGARDVLDTVSRRQHAPIGALIVPLWNAGLMSPPLGVQTYSNKPLNSNPF